jgi:hypothetical protein
MANHFCAEGAEAECVFAETKGDPNSLHAEKGRLLNVPE